MKILILGGYGVFGGRLAELLAGVGGIELIIAGRHLARAEAFCRRYTGLPKLHPAQIDRRDIVAALVRLAPDLVVDASGPFQNYGEDRYGVIAAAIAAGVDYIDFADAAGFVFGISAFDQAARAAGVFVLSGASSFPVLTAAVLREMARDMDIRQIEAGIAPSPFAGIGLNVMRAVVGYAGAPIKLTRGGRSTTAYGLAESRRHTVAVPGKVPLRNIRFSLVDVPDLQVLPTEYPNLTDIWVGAGPVPEILHVMLNLLAKARARFGLPSFEPLSPLFYRVLNAMKFGEHRGGMYVLARGDSNGRKVSRSWHMLAEGDDGPYIPSMPIATLIIGLTKGKRPDTGARPATHMLELSDYEALFSARTISTGFRADQTDRAALYPQLLGPAFATLPAAVQALHAETRARQWTGTADVERGKGPIAALIANAFDFPKAAASVPVSVYFSPEGEGERWTRDFGGRRFTSVQMAGTSRNQFLLVERFGPLSVSLALLVDGDRLTFVPRRWALLGSPLPRAALPQGQSYESAPNGRFTFNVAITLPLVGRIVAYRGELSPVPA